MYFTYTSVSSVCMCVHSRKEYWFPHDYSYRLYTSTWVPEIELRTSEEAASDLNHWVIPPAHNLNYFDFFCISFQPIHPHLVVINVSLLISGEGTHFALVFLCICFVEKLFRIFWFSFNSESVVYSCVYVFIYL